LAILASLVLSLCALARGPAALQAPETDPSVARRLYAQALEDLRGGRSREAAAGAARVAELDPKNPRVWALLGLARAASGDAARAIPAFERALALDPADRAALAGLASAYGSVSDPRAFEAYERAIAADRANLPLQVECAEFLWGARRYERGNAEMDRVLQAVPGNTRLRVHYGLALADQTRFADAVRQFEAARKAGDSSAELALYLGTSLWQAGRLEEATAKLREAAALAPGQAEPRHRLGRLLILRGEAAAAAAALQEAARLAPDSAPVELDLGRALEAAGRTEEAEAAYRRALALDPDLSAAHYTLGTLLARTGRREEAEKEIAVYRRDFQQQQERRFRNASRRAELDLGRTLLEAGKLEEALTQFARHPDDAEFLRGSADALSRLGRHADAVAALERARRLDPDSPALAWQLDREREKIKSP
jgi:Flp pilus assembly protein TadD